MDFSAAPMNVQDCTGRCRVTHGPQTARDAGHR